MSPVGIMILVHPAVLCLVAGSALLTTIVLWFGFVRFLPTTTIKIISMLAGLIGTFFLFAIVGYSITHIYPVHIETISSLY